MPDPSTLFAYAVAVLAALAVLAVLTYVIVWAVCGIRRTLADHRARVAGPPYDPTARYWPEHSAVTVVDMIPPPAP